MSWGRLDDTLHDHPKVEGLSLAAMGLWTKCLSKALRHEKTAPKPGFVSLVTVRSFAGTQTKKLTAELETPLPGKEFGMWEPVDGGWLIHDFAHYLPKRRDPEELAESGRRGAAKRWSKDGKQPSESDSSTHGNSHSTSHADGHGNSHELANGKTMADDGSRASAPAFPSRPVPKSPSDSLPRKRATRLPDDWKPTPADIAWQHEQSISDLLARREHPKFIDYWTAKSGKDAAKLDWSATWRNWLRNTVEREPKTMSRERPPGWEFGMN